MTSIINRYLVCFIILLFLILNLANLKNLTLIDWDEGVFAVQAKWLASFGEEGKPFNFQTPPLYQTLIAVLYKLFGTQDWFLPLLSIIFSCLTVYLFFAFAKILYSEEVSLFATIFFISSEYFLFFSKSGLSDAIFLFSFIGAIYFFYSTTIDKNRGISFLLVGLFTTLALYTKYSAPILLIIFFIIGLIRYKNINKKWFLLTIFLPSLLFLPYLLVFIKVVSLKGVGQRHMTLLGFNHLKFLYYLLIFSPIPIVLSLGYLITVIRKITKQSQTDYFILIPIIVFFIFLGFYHPYFRLAYPLVPFFSIFAAKFLTQTKRFKNYILICSVLVSFMLSFRTIIYKSAIPKRIAQTAENYVKQEHIKYIYTITPPNIYFYIKGKIVLPANHPAFNFSKKFPQLLKNRIAIHEDNNRLINENRTLLVHCTIFDSLKIKYRDLYQKAVLLESIEFVDAPVYYKDIFNPLRNSRQVYEIYLIDNNNLNNTELSQLWQLAFNPEVQLIYR